ncbi:MAG: hypothetical protein RIF33_02155 [Cyclobacteriaceae bacterium]
MKSKILFLIPILFWIQGCDPLPENADRPSLIKLVDADGDQEKPRFSNSGKLMVYSSNEQGLWQIFLYDLESKESKQLTTGSGSKNHVQWSPDDNFITYTLGQRNQSRIERIDLTTLKRDSITSWQQNASNAHWSPDGRKLVLDRKEEDKNVWLLDLTSGEQTQLTDLNGDETNFGFSFDAEWVGFRPRGSTTNHLQAIHLESERVKQLINDQEGFEWLPRWSSNALEVSFYSTWNGEMTDIWLTEVLSGSLIRITDENIEEFGPSLNENSNKVAYFYHNGTMQVMLHSRDMKQNTNLALHKDINVLWDPMSWLPNEDQLAFSGTSEYSKIHSIALQDSESRLLAPNRPKEHQYHPSVDESGEWIAYNNEEHEIILINDSAKEVISIPPLEKHHMAIFPTWIPNQPNRISFLYGEGGATDTNNLWSIDLTSKRREQITKIGGINRPYCWIDDDLVAFAHDPTTSYSNYEIWVHRLSTGKARRLVKHETASLFPTHSYGGDKLLFYGKIEGVNQIYEYSISSGTYSAVETGMQNAKWGQYSTDGRSIAFVSSDNDESFPDIYVLSLDGLATKRLTTSPEEEENLRWLDEYQVIYEFTRSNQDIYLVDVHRRLEEIGRR